MALIKVFGDTGYLFMPENNFFSPWTPQKLLFIIGSSGGRSLQAWNEKFVIFDFLKLISN